MELTSLIIYGLAIWRVSSLFVNEQGPYNIFHNIRNWIGVTYDGREIVKFWPQLFSCVWCMSIWMSIIWMVARHFFPLYVYWGSIPLALSAVAILVEKMVRIL